MPPHWAGVLFVAGLIVWAVCMSLRTVCLQKARLLLAMLRVLTKGVRVLKAKTDDVSDVCQRFVECNAN